MSKPTIGWVGTGIMGGPMVKNLLGAGYAVGIFTRTQAKADPLIAEGAQWHENPAVVAANSDVVITMVGDSPDVEAVYLSDDGVCPALGEGTLAIDMSTASPETARTVAAACARRGAGFVDAPVSGGANGAVAGTLAIMVGGSPDDVEKARPVFEVLGKSMVYCGPVGNGQLTKLCNQILCGLNLLAVCEALTFAQKAGLDLDTTIEVTSKGAAGSWALQNLGPRMASGDFDPMFMVDLQNKDLRLVLEMARNMTVPLPGTALVSQLLACNQASGEGRQGTQAMFKVLQRMAGVASAP